MGIGHTKIRLNREGVEPNNVDGPDHHHHDHIAQDWGLWKYDLWDLKTQTKSNVLVNPIPVSAGSIYSTVKAARKGHYLVSVLVIASSLGQGKFFNPRDGTCCEVLVDV